MIISRSIRWRLLLWYGLLLAAIISGLGLTAYHYENARKLNAVDTELISSFRVLEQFRRSVQNLESGSNGAELERRLDLVFVSTENPATPSKSEVDSPSLSPDQLSDDPEWHELSSELLGLDPKDLPPPRAGDPPPKEVDPPSWPRSQRNTVGSITSSDEREILDKFGPHGNSYFYLWFTNPHRYWHSSQIPENITLPAGSSMTFRQRGQYREVYRMPAKDDWILIGRSIEPEMKELHKTGLRLAGGGAILLILSLTGGWWLISQALRPIEAITQTAHRIAGGDLTQRIDLKETDSELGALAAVLNGTFTRLDAAFSQQARFTADAAHELRTPVTVILTHAQNGLAAEGGTEEHQEAFEACQRAGQRMRKLIESLLQLSRIDAGQEIRATAPCDLAEIALECVALVKPLVESSGLGLRVYGDPALVQGDHDRLAQVLTNLLSNAISYNKQGGEIRVTTGVHHKQAYCQVADSGQGISPEDLPHVFERFYRADKARTSHFGKSGLGLAISKSIADAHGGELTTTSTLGHGSTFTLWLPLA